MSKHVGSVDEVVLYKLVSNAESTGKDVHYIASKYATTFLGHCLCLDDRLFLPPLQF